MNRDRTVCINYIKTNKVHLERITRHEINFTFVVVYKFSSKRHRIPICRNSVSPLLRIVFHFMHVINLGKGRPFRSFCLPFLCQFNIKSLALWVVKSQRKKEEARSFHSKRIDRN